jgi:hypothetical protein
MANVAAHLVENVLAQCTSWIGSMYGRYLAPANRGNVQRA